jgi:tetratricopeptide (TPR) repeat protein
MHSNRSQRSLEVSLCLALLLALTACATPQTKRLLAAAPRPPSAVELTGVPFFPQREYQCGPAALATVLNDSGLATTPDQLVPEVYLPKRRGSLQIELLAAARRHGRLPYVLAPRLEAVVAEVAAGHPVLVLQNLGLSFAPVWHYAVVVGFDLDRARMVLRSGRERRHEVPLRTFEHTWRRAGYWAVVVTPPGRLPQTAEELPYLEAVLALEELARWGDAATAYAAALERWPQSLGAGMGLGNSRYALHDLDGAEAAFRATTRRHPDAAVAFNNLAQVLADRQRWDEAERAAQRAVEIGGEHADTFRRTLAEIQARSTPSPP